MSRTVGRWGTFPSQDQVSLWLSEQPGIFYNYLFWFLRTRSLEKLPFKHFRPPSRILVPVCPGLTFAFRQNAAEQRGESEPLHQTGRHRAFEAPGEALSRVATRYSASLKLWKRRMVLYFSGDRKSFSWPGKLWQLLLLLFAVICSSELKQRWNTRSWTLWRHREAGQMRQRRLRYTSLTAAYLNTPNLLVLSVVIHNRDTCLFSSLLLWTPTPRVQRQYCIWTRK